MTSDVVVKKRMRQVLVLVMALVVVGLAVLYGANRLHVPDPVLDEVEMDNQTLAALGGMEQTAIRNGIKEWHLKARRARILKTQNLAVLEGVTVRFFPINGDEIHLTSRSGTFNLDTRDMTLTDSVVVRQQDRQLETDRLHYEKKRHIIYTNNNVILTAPGARLTAGSLTIDLNAGVARLAGDVRGDFQMAQPDHTGENSADQGGDSPERKHGY